MGKRIAIRNLKEAVKLYYSKPELETQDIMSVFGCSSSTARRLKNQVQRKQIERGILTFSSSTINTRLAFELWGIDVDQAEKNLFKLQRLIEKTGSI